MSWGCASLHPRLVWNGPLALGVGGVIAGLRFGGHAASPCLKSETWGARVVLARKQVSPLRGTMKLSSFHPGEQTRSPGAQRFGRNDPSGVVRYVHTTWCPESDVRGGIGSGLQPSALWLTASQGFALGWYKTVLWPSGKGREFLTQEARVKKPE